MQKSIEAGAGRSGFWKGAAFGAVTGIGSLLTLQYLAGILRRPSLLSQAFVNSGREFATQEALAVFIAAENLRASIHTRLLTNGLSRKVMHAGYRNFRESWARDFGFAAYGLLSLGHFRTVRDTLEAFLWYQKEDGQFAVKLRSMSVVSRFLHSLLEREQPMQGVLTPKYVTGHGTASLDGQALLIIAALTYAREAEDREFLEKYWDKLKLAMSWLQSYCPDPGEPLLSQSAFADWADSVLRSGRVLYTNVVYWKALSEMTWAAAALDHGENAVQYAAQAGRTQRAIQYHFWRADLGYFATSNTLPQLSSDGNLLAIAWGLAQSDQADSILDAMQAAHMAEPVPTRVAFPSYPLNLIAMENRLGGMANYHTDASWLWLGAWHVVASIRAGRAEAARQLLTRIAEIIVRDRQVNEVHSPTGEPLSSTWYKPESPLAWNAGMVIYAFHVFESQQPQPEFQMLSLVVKDAR